jgi:hypothetical protein
VHHLWTRDTLVNDITYSGYHMFRGESRVVPGFNQDVEK